MPAISEYGLTPAACRARAVECMQKSEASEQRDKELWLKIAQHWQVLAQQADREIIIPAAR